MTGFYPRVGKRMLDLVLSIPAAIVSLPLQAAIAILVRVKLGSPVLFRQERPGKNGEVFSLVKFRTMTNETNSDGDLLPEAKRLTRFGHLLRSTSLDELPELFNVIRGDMSLVGPRPLLVKYLPRYTKEQARRHEVHPGLTGLAQISGRNSSSWDEKFERDIWYVDHVSVALDLRIMAKTVATVFTRQGVNAEVDLTAPEFMGSGESRS